MRTPYTIGGLLVCALSFFACSKVSSSEWPVIKVDITSPDDVSLFDFVERVELIQLENKTEALFSGGRLAISDDAFYFLHPVTRKIYRFSADGRWISTNNKSGRGHGEFTMAEDIIFCPKDSTVRILNPMGIVYRYSVPDGFEFRDTTEIHGPLRAVHEIWPLDDGKYLMYSMSEDARVYLYSPGEEIKILNDSHPRWIEFSRYCKTGFPFYEFDGAIRYYSSFTGEIYSFNPDNSVLTPYLRWDFGKNQISIEDIDEKATTSDDKELRRTSHLELTKKKVAPVNNVCETSRYVICGARFNRESYSVVHDKISGADHCFALVREGIHFSPLLAYKGDCYRYVPPEDIDYFVNESVLTDEDSRRVFRDISDDSNMIMIKYHMKR